MRLAQRLVDTIEKPIVIDGVTHHIGLAMGMAFYPQHGRTEQELIQSADIALYRAKTENRSAVRCYG